MRTTEGRFGQLLWAVLLTCVLSGCATDRRSEGLNWVEAQAAERQRLEAMGFPQFTGAQ